jgi:hypothetical protein
MFKWIAHVVRAWDLGSGPMASWAKCLKVLNTCRKWVRLAEYLNEAVRGFTITTLRVAAPARHPSACVRLGDLGGVAQINLVLKTVSYYPQTEE